MNNERIQYETNISANESIWIYAMSVLFFLWNNAMSVLNLASDINYNRNFMDKFFSSQFFAHIFLVFLRWQSLIYLISGQVLQRKRA